MQGVITQPAWALAPCPAHAPSLTALSYNPPLHPHCLPSPLTPPSDLQASFYLRGTECQARNGRDHLSLFLSNCGPMDLGAPEKCRRSNPTPDLLDLNGHFNMVPRNLRAH